MVGEQRRVETAEPWQAQVAHMRSGQRLDFGPFVAPGVASVEERGH
jgi:hypothetical protein